MIAKWILTLLLLVVRPQVLPLFGIDDGKDSSDGFADGIAAAWERQRGAPSFCQVIYDRDPSHLCTARMFQGPFA